MYVMMVATKILSCHCCEAGLEKQIKELVLYTILDASKFFCFLVATAVSINDSISPDVFGCSKMDHNVNLASQLQ
ncbi:hypothetical protein L6452_03284 [Arctium lappa]|uniref:Uncharacterized protein n=1 Tax=Arctium lappa TaxID=4217 RepID=A0ACB9FLG0_ARCLA|nr:hypothetical protein L6452_03284 [Arctium lappa]